MSKSGSLPYLIRDINFLTPPGHESINFHAVSREGRKEALPPPLSILLTKGRRKGCIQNEFTKDLKEWDSGCCSRQYGRIRSGHLQDKKVGVENGRGCVV